MVVRSKLAKMYTSLPLQTCTVAIQILLLPDRISFGGSLKVGILPGLLVGLGVGFQPGERAVDGISFGESLKVGILLGL